MPYHNFGTAADTQIQGHFDYTIVGAGAAGIFLAVNLSKLGYKVMLIESGLLALNERHQALNDVISTGLHMGGISWGRKRATGGTTIAWGGQSLPFSALDFEHPYRKEEDTWPISFDEINAHYAAANAFMGITDNEYYGQSMLSKIKLRNPGFDEKLLTYHVSKWAKEPNFHKLYQSYLEANVFVLYNATVSNLKHDGNRISELEIINFDEKRCILPVDTLILATGAVECNRVLLNHPSLFSKYQNYDVLGKGFMDHPCITVGHVETKNHFKLQRYFNTHHINGNKISLRLSLSRKKQLDENLLNCSVSILFVNEENFELYQQIKDILRKFSFKSALQLVPNLPKLMVSLYAYGLKSFFYKVKTIPEVSLMIEQESIKSSYLDLSDVLDEMGQRKTIVHWDISKASWNTVVKTTEVIKSELERLNFGKVVVDAKITADNPNWKQLLSDVNHHMGGCKMSATPAHGIVDENLKVWGLANLFIASTAVFPTGSHSNPTLTLLALCARMVKNFEEKIKSY